MENHDPMTRSANPAGRLSILEGGAKLLRRARLGRLVDATAHRFGSKLGRFEVELEGLKLGGDRVGHLYYARELTEGDRESYFRELFVEAIDAGDTILEGGPYIGYLTLHAARVVGDRGHVVVVEANPETVATLRANIARNGFEERTRVVEAALGAEPGRARFHLTEGGDTSSLHLPAHSTSTIEVDVVRGDDLVSEADVVKLDLEGNEVAALRGLQGVIAASRPVIFCECNPEMLTAAGSSAAELRAGLEQLGYTVQWIDEERKALRSFDEPWGGGYVNLHCLPGSR